MVVKIQVAQLGCGRILAKVLPHGPMVEADSQDTAVDFARRAHESSLKMQSRFLPEEAWGETTYQVTSLGSMD
jgi:hypothetical protein